MLLCVCNYCSAEAEPQDPLLVLNTAAVVGVALALFVAIVVAYAFGILTGILVRKKRHTPSMSHENELATAGNRQSMSELSANSVIYEEISPSPNPDPAGHSITIKKPISGVIIILT